MKYLAETMVESKFPKEELKKFVTDPARYEKKEKK